MLTNVQAIASKLADNYDIEMDIYNVSENSMEALNQMGMLRMRSRAVVVQAKQDSQQVRLPVDVYDVKAVFDGAPCWRQLGNLSTSIQDIEFPPQKVWVPVPNSDDDSIDEFFLLSDEIINYLPHLKGPYLDYVWDAPFIKFNQQGAKAVVYYSAIPIDPKTGLCEIPDQAFLACVNYCVFVHFRPLFLSGKIPKYVWDEVKDWKKKYMQQAEVKLMMSQLSQNEMSKVHNIMSSFDRKRTGIDS